MLYLPDGLGRVAVGVLRLGGPGADVERNEEAIADLARTASDSFLFQ